MSDPQNPASLLPARQGQGWTTEEERRLYNSFVAGQPIERIASVHHRSEGGICARPQRLGLIDENGEVIQPPPAFAPRERRRSRSAEGSEAAQRKQAMRLVFAVTAADGWRLEIKSNRPLNRAMIERLSRIVGRHRRLGARGRGTVRYVTAVDTTPRGKRHGGLRYSAPALRRCNEKA